MNLKSALLCTECSMKYPQTWAGCEKYQPCRMHSCCKVRICLLGRLRSVKFHRRHLCAARGADAPHACPRVLEFTYMLSSELLVCRSQEFDVMFSRIRARRRRGGFTRMCGASTFRLTCTASRAISLGSLIPGDTSRRGYQTS